MRPGSDEEEYVPPSSHEGASHVARWILDRFERVGLAHFGVAPSTSTDERPRAKDQEVRAYSATPFFVRSMMSWAGVGWLGGRRSGY